MGAIEGALNKQSYSFGQGWTRAWNNTTISYPNNNQAYIKVEGQVRSGDDGCRYYRLADYGTATQVGIGGVNGTGASWHDGAGVYNYCNWVGYVAHTYTVNRGSSDAGCQTWTKYWGQVVNGRGAAKNSGELYNSITVARIPATKPPVPSNVKLVRNSDSQATATWQHTGSGLSIEKKSFVDGETNQSGNWPNLYNGNKTTSYVWKGLSANSCYRVRIGAENDAGNAGTWGYSNYMYTTPAAPKSISNAIAIINSGTQELSFNIDKGNTRYPSTKVDFQYSNDNSTWRGSGGSTGGVYSVNSSGAVALSAGSMDGTLKSYINNMKNGGKLYIRARVWNADNSLASGFSGSIGVAFSEQSRVYIWVPDGTNVNNVRVYVNKP